MTSPAPDANTAASVTQFQYDTKGQLKLNAQLPEAHAALANLDFSYFWNFSEAEEESRKALALDPNYAYAHGLYCWIQASKGRSQEALAECRRAVELDPLSPMNNFALADSETTLLEDCTG